MAYDPPPLISREAPRHRRRRRRAQQQSSCCCCAIVAASLIIVLVAWRGTIFSVFSRHRHVTAEAGSAAFPLGLNSDAPTYLRYNLVRLAAAVVDPRGKVQLVSKPPEITVSHEGHVVATVGDFTSITPTFDRNRQTYVANWPIPWNAPAGEYIAEARMAIKDPQSWSWETQEQRRQKQRQRRRQPTEEPPTGASVCLARARFVITGRSPAAIPKGTCVATWEPDFRPTGLRAPDGRIGDWRIMFDWCEFIGADTLWFRGAVTEGKRSLEEPFNPQNIEAIPEMAAEAHHRGLRFGTWASAYTTYPGTRPKYDYAQDVSLGSGAIHSVDFVSLLDRRRADHIANFLGGVQDQVDYLGLDYMRSDRGGYEMTDLFTKEMPLRLPAGFSSWSRSRRWAYVAQKREREWQTDPRFYDAWNWWRAHTGAEIVRDIISRGQLNKPLWIFVLSWWHGKQHGQDPLMFTDAGAGLLAPMLYQVDSRGIFDTMVRDWNGYLAAGQANICAGDQVDFYWHQRMLQPRAAPEELYDRLITAHGAKGKGYEQGGYTMGAFWHDISRAMTPDNDGPYPGTEWALAGGSAFSVVRMTWRVYPLVAKLEMPASAPLNTTVEGQLTLQNVVRKGIKRVTLKLEKTAGVELAGPLESVSIRGDNQVIVPVRVRLKGGHGDRANRLMTCVRITWTDDDYGDTVRRDLPRVILVMDYVQGR